MSTAEKRSNPDPSNPQPQKYQRTGDGSAKVAALDVTVLGSVSVTDIDKYVTTLGRSDGICSIDTLQLLEARFAAPLAISFSALQSRLLKAQFQYFDQMVYYASFKEPQYKNLPTHKILADQCARLLVLAEDDTVKNRPSLEDAILYRIAFMSSYAAFCCGGGAREKFANDVYSTIIDKANVATNTHDLFGRLVSASERHLSRPQDRSYIWNSPEIMSLQPASTASQSSNLTVPVPVPVPSSTIQAPETLVRENSDAGSDQWVVQKASQFITSWEKLSDIEDVTDWDTLDMISEEDRNLFEDARMSRMIEYGEDDATPGGFMLYGAQGVGKTTLARHWCHHIKGTLVELDNRAKGHLQGLTEDLIRYLVTKAIDIGKSSPVVLLLDEADQLLGSADSEFRRETQELMKMLFSSVQRSRSEVYLIAVTNTPAELRAKYGWNRRLRYKVHVKLPSTTTTAAIISKTVKKWGAEIPDADIERCASKLGGFSVDDIVIMMEQLKRSRLSGAWLRQVSSWKKEFDGKGREVLRAANSEDEADVRCSWRDLTLDQKATVARGKLSGRALEEWVDSYAADPRNKTIPQSEVDEHQKYADGMSQTAL